MIQAAAGVVEVQEGNADLQNDVIIQAAAATVEAGLSTATLSYP